MLNEGFIKFRCLWLPTPPLDELDEEFIIKINLLNQVRQKLYILKFIGSYPDGIGYGNISLRHGSENHFIITGTQTGHLSKLDGRHYCEVMNYDITKNFISCRGAVKASSESLSHAVIYDVLAEINAVIHVHDKKLWEKLKNKMPATSENVQYGTPEMAEEIKRILNKPQYLNQKIIIMGGHPEGIISFGKNLNEACKIILNLM